jgi:hypothetical protein
LRPITPQIQSLAQQFPSKITGNFELLQGIFLNEQGAESGLQSSLGGVREYDLPDRFGDRGETAHFPRQIAEF